MKYYLKKHWKMNILIVFLQIAWAATAVIPNVMLIHMMQAIIELDMKAFLYWAIADMLMWFLNSALEHIRTCVKSRAIWAMNQDLRRDIAATILEDGHGEFHAKLSGEHLSRLTNDVTQIQSLAWESVYAIISIVARVVISMIALAEMHWSLLVVSAVSSIVMFLLPKLTGKRVAETSKNFANAQGAAMSRMKDMIAGVDILRSFGRKARFLDATSEASCQIEEARHKYTCTRSLLDQGVDVLNTICQLGISTAIGILSIQGIIIQAALFGSGNMVGTIANGFGNIARQYVSIKSAKPYFENITIHAGDVQDGTGAAEPVQEAVMVENLSFSYGDKPVLENVSFRFEKGGKYALTGPSGCGKSTLLKVLLGWLPDYVGTISFDKKNAKDFTSEQLQQQMSYIEQDVFLFNTTIRDNITLGEDFTDEQIAHAVQASALVGDLASMSLGLDTPVGEDGCYLSGGQKQRVAIARALIHNRSILLVDEGTSALDQKNADIVEESLISNPDLTLILVSHHLSPERKAQFTKVFELKQP